MILNMKKFQLKFLVVVLGSLLIVSCARQTQPIATPTHTDSLTPVATIKATATFLPTFTPSIPTLRPIYTATLTPLPNDIFDNFQGLSGNCRVKVEGGLELQERLVELYSTDVTIDFDKDEYSPGNPIKISASIISSNENYNYGAPEPLHGIVAKMIVEDPTLQRYSFDLDDDGAHGDEGADDGIYTSVFNNTLETGIYKFYFQLTNHNKDTGETFIRECYLAKTVRKINVITEENKSCRKIETSTPVIVRAEGVGESGSSDLGGYAFHPRAVSMGTDILATWHVGFDGESPKPNAFMRLLDTNAKPIGEVKLLFERNWTGQSYSLVKKDDDAILTYCGRYKVGAYFEDRVTSAFLDTYGVLVSEQVRSPSNRACSYAAGDTIWTGSRMLFAWTDVNSTSFNPDLILDIADTDGNSLAWKSIRSNAGAYPHLAIGHGRVFLVATNTRGTFLAVHRFDLEGNEVGEPLILSPLSYEAYEKVVVGRFETPYIVPTANGWMILASSKPYGIYVAQLTPDGQLASEPFVSHTTLYFTNGFDDVLAYKGGAVVLDYDVALFLSGNGIIYQQWYPERNEPPSFGSLFEHQSRLYLIYTGGAPSGNPNANQVLVRELQCVP